MEQISNGVITIDIKDHGAELASLKFNGREYLWQADKAFWQRHSPVLFPIVGSVWGGEFRTKGLTYKMGQHGFARDMDFVMINKSDNQIWYRLTSSDATKAKYPYEFVLEIGYKLIGNRVRVMWHVENTGDEVMPFQIGAHPAFYWPLLTEKEIDGGVDAMAGPLAATDDRGYFKINSKTNLLVKSVITEGGCVSDESTVTLDDDGYLKLSLDTFSKDALVFENSVIDKVTLCDRHKKPYLSLEFTSPAVGLWSPPGKRAPFVCIEPWYGRCDDAYFTGDFAEKKWVQILNPSQCFDASYDIIIEV